MVPKPRVWPVSARLCCDPAAAADLDPALPHGAQVQVVMQEQPQQLTAGDVELTLQLGMVQSAAGHTVEPAHDRRELRAGGRETLGPGSDDAPGHRPRRARNAAMPASAARSSSARALLKRASPAATSATSASANVRVLVRPPSL